MAGAVAFHHGPAFGNSTGLRYAGEPTGLSSSANSSVTVWVAYQTAARITWAKSRACGKCHVAPQWVRRARFSGVSHSGRRAVSVNPRARDSIIDSMGRGPVVALSASAGAVVERSVIVVLIVVLRSVAGPARGGRAWWGLSCLLTD